MGNNRRFFTIISAFIGVMKVVVNVNRALTALEVAVKELKDYMEKQSGKNELFVDRLSEHEQRITKLEERILALEPTTKKRFKKVKISKGESEDES